MATRVQHPFDETTHCAVLNVQGTGARLSIQHLIFICANLNAPQLLSYNCACGCVLLFETFASNKVTTLHST